jgi:hypothetical protein
MPKVLQHGIYTRADRRQADEQRVARSLRSSQRVVDGLAVETVVGPLAASAGSSRLDG